MGQALYIRIIRDRFRAFLILGNVGKFGSNPATVESPPLDWELLTLLLPSSLCVGTWVCRPVCLLRGWSPTLQGLSGFPERLWVWQGAHYICSLCQCPWPSRQPCCPLLSQKFYGPGNCPTWAKPLEVWVSPYSGLPRRTSPSKLFFFHSLKLYHFTHLLLIMLSGISQVRCCYHPLLKTKWSTYSFLEI